VSTNNPYYFSNSVASITVTVKANGNPVNGATVTLAVTAPNGVISQFSGTSGSNGQAIFQFTIGSRPTFGTYKVAAQASLSGYNPGSGSTTFFVF